MLSRDEKRELLTVARDALVAALRHEPYQAPQPVSDALSRPRGAFVTLRIEHELRGCIGYVETEKALLEVVAEVAVKAAFDDPRFVRLTWGEFERATIEVSVLSPLRRISSIQEIEIGIHGLVVALGTRRGLLLPQVAVEHRLNAESFLEAAAQKAGLPPNAWQLPEAELYVFEAEVVQEADVLQ